jgi:hypothetical protein
MGAVKTFRKLLGPAIDWVKNKAAKGKAWVKGKVAAGKQWVTDKARSVKDRVTGGPAAAESHAADAAHPAEGTPEAEARSEAVRGEAHGRLVASANDLTSITAAKAKATEIRQELAPRGLKSMELVEVDEDTFDVIMQASAAKKGGTVKRRKRPADVTLHANVDFSSEPEWSKYLRSSVAEKDDKGNIVMEDGKPKMAEAAHSLPGVSSEHGGTLAARDPSQPKRNVVKTESGRVSPKRGTNRSHAERTFENWVTNILTEKERRSVTSANLRLVGKWGPCDGCTQTLVNVATVLKQAGASAALALDLTGANKPHRSIKKDDMVAQLRAAGWDVTPMASEDQKEDEEEDGFEVT